MKQYLLVSFLFGALTASAWNVGTDPTRKSALIEEFTGIQCSNCPDGHRIATALANLHPEDVYIVAVHAGYFSDPRPGQPDFVTETGKAIHDYFGVSSYPCGDVNRHDYGNGIILSRSNWGAACREALKEQSPVNLWSVCSYDATTRTLKVDVEGYYTADMNEPRLTVWLLQNEILGPQSGGNMGEEYPHRHMLRAKLTTDDFGDPIGEKTAGEYFARTFEYFLPEAINDVATDPVNTQVLCFVSDGATDICKVSESRPDTSGMEQLFSVSTSQPPIAIGKNYAMDYVEIYINNHGGIDVTSATFDLDINGMTETVEWIGLVPARTNLPVKVPVTDAWGEAVDNENNQYAIRMMKANGREVETASIRGKFNELFSYPDKLTVTIKTDLDAGDNTWRIIDRQGNVVKEFGPFEDGVVAEYTDNVELRPDQIYGLEVFDCWGDGVRHPIGSVKIYDADGNAVTTIREISDYGFRQFFRTYESAGVANLVSDSQVTDVKYYDLSGRPVANPSCGIYLVRSTYSDGHITTEKHIISE